MKRVFASVLLVISLLAADEVLAAEQTVTLKLENTCPTCGYIVKKVLGRVSGVEQVAYSARDDTTTVIFDDAQTDVKTLIATTTSVGFPSRVVE